MLIKTKELIFTKSTCGVPGCRCCKPHKSKGLTLISITVFLVTVTVSMLLFI